MSDSQILERLGNLCLAEAGAVERLSHGEPTWFTGPKGKCFAMFDNHHHGAKFISVHLAAPLEVQRALVTSDPDRFWVPPYVGHRGWVAIVLEKRPSWVKVGQLVHAAFLHVAKTSIPAR